MTTQRRAAAAFAAPTINLASLVCGLDAYLLSTADKKLPEEAIRLKRRIAKATAKAEAKAA